MNFHQYAGCSINMARIIKWSYYNETTHSQRKIIYERGEKYLGFKEALPDLTFGAMQ
jgi:hypothetical protein